MYYVEKNNDIVTELNSSRYSIYHSLSPKAFATEQEAKLWIQEDIEKDRGVADSYAILGTILTTVDIQKAVAIDVFWERT